MHTQRGITLVEILIVLVILGVLGGGAIALFYNAAIGAISIWWVVGGVVGFLVLLTILSSLGGGGGRRYRGGGGGGFDVFDSFDGGDCGGD